MNTHTKNKTQSGFQSPVKVGVSTHESASLCGVKCSEEENGRTECSTVKSAAELVTADTQTGGTASDMRVLTEG